MIGLGLSLTLSRGTGEPPTPAAPDLTVTLSGSGVVGSPLAVSVSGRGYPAAVLTYQWTRGVSNISGATASSYTPVEADIGEDVNCTVTAADNGTGSDVASAAVPITVAASPAVNTSPPVITGSGKIGSEHTVSDGTWTGGTGTFTRQWNRDGAPIAGAASAAYTPVAADDLTTLTCTVTGFGGAAATSAGVAITYAAPVAVGTITPKTVAQDSVATYDASGDFTGTVSTWSITDGAATVNSSGLITFTTTGLLTDDPVTVQASSSGGSDTQTFNLSVVVDPVATISSPSFSEGALSFNVDGAADVYAIFSDDALDSLAGSQIKTKQQAGITGTTYAVATGAVTAGSNSISIDTASVPAGLRVLHIATENGAGFDTASFEFLFEEFVASGIGAMIIGTDFTIVPPEGSIGNAAVGSTLTVAA